MKYQNEGKLVIKDKELKEKYGKGKKRERKVKKRLGKRRKGRKKDEGKMKGNTGMKTW